jgi:hypothetical protein
VQASAGAWIGGRTALKAQRETAEREADREAVQRARELRAAARLVQHELIGIAGELVTSVDRGRRIPIDVYRKSTWAELAPEIARTDHPDLWPRLMTAYLLIDGTRPHAGQPDDPLPDDAERIIRVAIDAVARALTTLAEITGYELIESTRRAIDQFRGAGRRGTQRTRLRGALIDFADTLTVAGELCEAPESRRRPPCCRRRCYEGSKLDVGRGRPRRRAAMPCRAD